MKKIIALMGKAGSGKDTLMKSILSYPGVNMNEIISCTTRPIRENEKDGVNYYYLTVDEFLAKKNNNEMLETANFNNWYYGTSYDSLSDSKINIGVFNPTGVRSLLQHPDVEVKVYYVTVPAKERLIRQLNREERPDVDEIIRRYSTDEADFKDLTDIPYIEFDNSTLNDLTLNTLRIVGSL